MVMYKDSSDWKRHYDDWAKFLATAKWDKDNVTKAQHEYKVVRGVKMTFCSSCGEEVQ